MRRSFRWMALILLCCAAKAGAGEEQKDAGLAESQAALDQATKLKTAGKYAEAILQAERALALREAALGEKHPDVANSLDLLGDAPPRSGAP